MRPIIIPAFAPAATQNLAWVSPFPSSFPLHHRVSCSNNFCILSSTSSSLSPRPIALPHSLTLANDFAFTLIATMSSNNKVKYILLDCDNTLCQSERLAFEACAELTNEVLKKHDIPDRYDVDSLLEDFVGHNFRNMLIGLQKKHNFTMTADEVDEYVAMELGKVTQKLSEKCVECPGVTEQLEWARKQGYPMAVVSTSAKPRVIASLKKTNLMRFFTDEKVFSAASSMPKPSSKPDPAIYLWACDKLGVKPEECLTVEDSKSGATAGMRAGIPLIGYVGIYKLEEGAAKEKQMAETLTEVTKAEVIMYDWKEFPECVKKIEAKL
ncbi:Hypothetical protein R9X50_00295600 [Acrodontium crateriforme]|uniref:Uncharacterized protein n=1 Tax=Acrodontium crateriforme TaxID=150365 RepID=A0AAQ3RBE6_9PEZI|nr:Hypothetical protein R9X50_00295600 [Acrodontium crateriforme]